jgi:flagellar biogenesis protein FliO
MDPTTGEAALPSLEYSSGGYALTFLKGSLTLIALIILLGATVWFLRRLIQQRWRRNGGVESIHLLEKKMISPKTTLYLLEVEGKKIIIAESQLEIRNLGSVESLESPLQ